MKQRHYAGLSDTGRQREHNEDSYGLLPAQGIAVLADGMGGHNAGEVASQIAVSTIMTLLSQTQGLAAHERLETAIQAAQAAILEKAASASRYQGMGTTVVALLLEDKQLQVAHVGDSRLYLLHKNQLQCLTRDHTLQQEFIDQGHYSAEEAREKVARHILTHALGLEQLKRIDNSTVPIHSGDRLLLCSDGLHDMVSADSIAAILARGQSAEASCAALVELANAHGGRDNISVIVIDC